VICNGSRALYELIGAPNEACEAQGNEYKIQHVIRVLTFRFKNAPLSISDRVSYGNVSAEQTPTPVKSERLIPTIYVLS
jgi:hypothetical protein